MIFALAAGVFVLARVVYILERARRSLQRQQDSELLEHLLFREHVICPDCRSVFAVTCLEEQMNTTWQCAVCKCKFKELPHHTAKEGEL
jgi:hypothetical protein